MAEDRINQKRNEQPHKYGRLRDWAIGLGMGTAVAAGSLFGATKPNKPVDLVLEARVASSWNGPANYGKMPPTTSTTESENLATQGVYDFSGYIKGFPDSLQSIDGATLTFKSPAGDTYPSVQTDNSGYYQTSIDTYVKMDDVQLGRDIAVSTPVLNPTADRSGFYMNIPYNAKVTLNGCNERGRDITDEIFKDRMDGTIQPGVYFQEVDFSGLSSSGRVFVNVQIGNEIKTLKFAHVKGSTNTYQGIHTAPGKNSSRWMKMQKARTQGTGGDGSWEITIEHPDYRPRKVLFNAQEGDNFFDFDLINKSWDLDFFDEITYRSYGGGTERWEKCPKLLIIDGSPEGYNNFETPTQAEIDTLIKVWKDYQKYTNGFIDIPDSNIYVTHDVNDPNFQDAVEQIYNGDAKPDTTNGKRYDISLWTDKVSTGAHGELVENGEIKGAVQMYKQGYAGRSIMQEESSQSIGFPNDPADLEKRSQNGEFTELYKQCMHLNYSRPSWTLSPDKATKPLN